MSFAKLDELCRTLEWLAHARAILGADEATHMAVGGGEKRAEAMGGLAGMYHRRATAPEVSEWIEAARGESLAPEQVASLREFERFHVNMTCLPAEFVERQARTQMRCEQLWRDLRIKNDWLSFLPALESVVTLAREEAQMRAAALGIDPYDAMIEQHDPDMRSSEIEPLFDDLKRFLAALLPQALEAQSQRLANRPLREMSGGYSIERQRELGLAVMAMVGFDFIHGSLSISHHPFCGGVPTDVRITTRYRSAEFLSSLMAVMHETGHALYEQNLPGRWSHWPSGHARGMAMHESQSLFVEKQIGRNAAFWRHVSPMLESHLGESWELADILAHIHHVSPGLIRVDADELTYPLHVILRFELERELMSGSLEVAHLPEAWDAKMLEYLGLSSIDNPGDGVMQDVHWPSGAFGYFPSYTLGAIMAAQQWARIQRECPDIDEQIARGQFDFVNDWRRERIWAKGSLHSSREIMEQATGERLNVAYFKSHLQRRYGNSDQLG